MAVGTVKWFDEKKGFGFIIPEDGGSDLFVHHSNIVTEGFRTLKDGQKVEFEPHRAKKDWKQQRLNPAKLFVL